MLLLWCELCETLKNLCSVADSLDDNRLVHHDVRPLVISLFVLAGLARDLLDFKDLVGLRLAFVIHCCLALRVFVEEIVETLFYLVLVFLDLNH